MPAIEILAERKPHGSRLRYLAGCRCLPCRASNSTYETKRLRARKHGDWNGFVPASRARTHLMRLSRAGIGRRAVSIACNVGKTTIQEIRQGTKRTIRARTERKILSVTRSAVSGGALISAAKTWMQISRLLSEGFSKAELARRLGYRSPAIQLNAQRVTARNAMKVGRFYRMIMAGAA